MSLWPQARKQEETAYRSISVFDNSDSQIVGITCTPKYIYIVNKNKELIFYSNSLLNVKQVHDRRSKILNIVPNSIQKIGYFISKKDQQVIIYVISGNVLYIRNEGSGLVHFRQAVLQQEDGKTTPFGLNFLCTLDNHQKIVTADSYGIKIVNYIGDGVFVVENKIMQKMKLIDLIGSNNSHFLVFERGQYSVFDQNLNCLKKEPSGKISFISPVDGMNTFIAVSPGNQIQCIGDKIETCYMKYSDEIIALQIRLPYFYGFSQRNFTMTTSVTPIQEKIEFNDRMKSPLICVLNNYTVMIANGSVLYCCKYSTLNSPPYSTHLLYLQGSGQKERFDYMLKLCQAIKHPDFKTEETLLYIYMKYSKHLFEAGGDNVRKAFELFVKSGQHPFVLIRMFRSLFQKPELSSNQENHSLQYLAQKDCDEYMSLLKKLKDLIDNNAPINEIVESKISCIKQANSKEEYPTVESIKKDYNKLKNWVANSIEETAKTHDEIKNILCANNSTFFISGSNGYNELQQYLEEILKKETQPTKIKIYNTILFQCYAGSGATLALEKAIPNNNPIFFDIVSDTLIKNNCLMHHLLLCNVYGHHEVGLRNYTKPGEEKWEQVINYIKESKDFLKLGEEYYPKILNATNPENAVEVFKSNYLKPKDVSTVLEIIQRTATKQDDENCLKAKILFLKYDIFEKDDETEQFHSDLIDLYLHFLKLNMKFRNKYIKISSEKEVVKFFRTGLLDILNYKQGKFYNSKSVLNKISAVEGENKFLIEEKLAVYKKLLRTKETGIDPCIRILTTSNVDFSVALDFCDSVYDENNDYTNNVYTELFYAYCLQRTENNTRIDSYLLRLLNEKGDRMNLQTIIASIPKNFSIQSLNNFFKITTLKYTDKLRLLKIQNALLKKTIEEKKKQKEYLKGGKVEVDSNNPKCIVCGKPVFGSYFVVLTNNCVAHIACANKNK